MLGVAPDGDAKAQRGDSCAVRHEDDLHPIWIGYSIDSRMHARRGGLAHALKLAPAGSGQSNGLDEEGEMLERDEDAHLKAEGSGVDI